MSTGIAHKEVLKSKRGRRMTVAEWEFATDDYKELRKGRKMKATQFKEYRDDITEGKFPRGLIAKALKIAKKSGGQMTKAWKQIEKIKKGLGDDPAVADALKLANEEAVSEWNTGTRRCKGGDGRRKLVKAQRALDVVEEDDEIEEGSKQITANPKDIKSLLKKHKIKVTRKEKDLFLPKGYMDITLDGDDENLKAFLDDYYEMESVEVEEGYSRSHIKKAVKIAHDMGGNMTGAIKKIEKIKKGLSDDEAVMDALKTANEELDERDYRKEYDNYQGTPDQIARRSSRNKARRVMGDDCEDGQDVGHKDNNPMNNDRANLRNEDPSKNRREPRLRKEAGPRAIPMKVLLKKYHNNEDDNQHSENYLLLAKTFGTPKEVKEVEAIIKRNKKQGHTSEKDNKWMLKNINPYYRKLVSSAKKESFSGYREAIQERKLTDKELKRREEIAKNLDDEDLKKRYGDDWKAVKMGIATNMAKAESLNPPAVVKEAKAKYKIDHKTYSSAVDEALKVADKQGYEVDMDDYFNQIATGPRKPGEGKTNTFKIALTKKGKEQRKKLQIQIYGKGKHGYELNCYIS